MSKQPVVALVSGANRGIGAAIAAGLAREGALVLLGARDLESGKVAAEAMHGAPGSIVPVPLDVSDDSSVQDLAAWIEQHYGKLDILVNNAGIGLDYAPGLSEMQKLQQTLEINVLGTLRLTQAMEPLILASGHGRIVNVSSSLASFALRQDASWEHADKILPTYAASKAALNALTLSLAARLGPQGVKANAICPGYTATAATNFGPDRTPEQAAVIAIRMAMLDEDGPNGGFFNDQGPLPW